jgi:hypothetical protein
LRILWGRIRRPIGVVVVKERVIPLRIVVFFHRRRRWRKAPYRRIFNLRFNLIFLDARLGLLLRSTNRAGHKYIGFWETERIKWLETYGCDLGAGVVEFSCDDPSIQIKLLGLGRD